MENVWSIGGTILPSHYLCIPVDKGSSFVLSPFKHTALELFLAPWPWLPYDDSRKWPNTESLPLTSFIRTMRSHTIQSDWSARHSPSQWWLWGLRHHNEPLCPSTCISGCWGRSWYNFLTPDTSVCLILGCGDSGAWCFFSWPSEFPSVLFFLWLICPPSTFLPVPSLYEPLPKSFDSKSVPQSCLVISTFDHPLPSGGLWGA